ncbi:hypothetical protein [Runella sp.]|uniref:hypothetical protein n=1 Tax=Runella sp. TaxID=1960881 RepID=UPI003D0FBD06
MITLAEYLGFIFSEISAARKMADESAVEIAKSYAKDDIMKFFSIPRFKIPTMELKIPVAISGIKFKSVLKLNLTSDEFRSFIRSQLQKIEQDIFIRKNKIMAGPQRFELSPNIFISRPSVVREVETRDGSSSETEIMSLYSLLTENPELSDNNNVLSIKLSQILQLFLEEKNLSNDYKSFYVQNEPFAILINAVEIKIKNTTVVIKNTIENLLVNPETQVIKEIANDISIFQINTKIIEDGFFIHSVKDENNTERPIVEFE